MSARTLILTGAVLAACAGAAAAQDVQGAADLSKTGGALFEEKCAMCHREANMVTGMGTYLIAARDPVNDPMLENRDLLTPEYIAAVVRSGVGNMPRISRAEVSDAQLAEIAAYLVASADAEEDAE